MKEILKNAVSHNYVFWLCLFISIFLIVGGAITPPPFIMDLSIFEGVGWLFAFATLGVFSRAIDKGIDARVKKGDTTLEIGDLNKRENDDLIEE